MSRRLVLWRHGRTDWNARDLAQGQRDVPLDDTGRAQARRAAPALARYRPARIVASDLSRARDTAQVLADEIGLEVRLDKRMREFHLGDREGLTTPETYERFGAEMAAWQAGQEARFGDSESLSQTAERYTAGLDEVAADTADGEVSVVVSHGGAMRVGILAWLGVPQELWGRFGGFGNCRWAVLHDSPVRPGVWRLAHWNAGVETEDGAAPDASSAAGGEGSVDADDV